MTPFPLDGGRVGDGGEARRPVRTSGHAPGVVSRARRLRKAMTNFEKLLWTELRRSDLHFRRQAPVGRYVADFASHACKLIVELDGGRHEMPEAHARDAERDVWFASQGYRTLRFRNAQVEDDLNGVLGAIRTAALSPPSPTLPPSRGKGA